MSGLKWQAILGCLVVLCTLGGSRAFAEATPYQQIIDRNVFALKPPAPPPKPEDNRPPPPNIKMTGIITLLGQKRVLLKLQPPPKPGAKAEEESFILASGERQGEVEVLEIDEKNGIVKVNDYGTITNLTWENNGVKVAAAPPRCPTWVRAGRIQIRVPLTPQGRLVHNTEGGWFPQRGLSALVSILLAPQERQGLRATPALPVERLCLDLAVPPAR